MLKVMSVMKARNGSRCGPETVSVVRQRSRYAPGAPKSQHNQPEVATLLSTSSAPRSKPWASVTSHEKFVGIQVPAQHVNEEAVGTKPESHRTAHDVLEGKRAPLPLAQTPPNVIFLELMGATHGFGEQTNSVGVKEPALQLNDVTDGVKPDAQRVVHEFPELICSAVQAPLGSAFAMPTGGAHWSVRCVPTTAAAISAAFAAALDFRGAGAVLWPCRGLSSPAPLSAVGCGGAVDAAALRPGTADKMMTLAARRAPRLRPPPTCKRCQRISSRRSPQGTPE